jgi:hypothetical protein
MKKIIFILLPAIFILISCSKERTPDPFFSATISNGIDLIYFEATTALGEVGDSIQVIATEPSGSLIRIVVPSNNKKGSYATVLPGTGANEAQIQYASNVTDLSTFYFADSGTLNITKIDDQGWENLIDGNFKIRLINLTDTIRIEGEFASIPIILK